MGEEKCLEDMTKEELIALIQQLNSRIRIVNDLESELNDEIERLKDGKQAIITSFERVKEELKTQKRYTDTLLEILRNYSKK